MLSAPLWRGGLNQHTAGRIPLAWLEGTALQVTKSLPGDLVATATKRMPWPFTDHGSFKNYQQTSGIAAVPEKCPSPLCQADLSTKEELGPINRGLPLNEINAGSHNEYVWGQTHGWHHTALMCWPSTARRAASSPHKGLKWCDLMHGGGGPSVVPKTRSLLPAWSCPMWGTQLLLGQVATEMDP